MTPGDPLTHGPGARVAARRSHLLGIPRPALILVAFGILLFVLGVLGFVHLQTQHIFRETADLEVSSGAIPRNDGGILFGALLTGLGPGLVLLGLSPLPRRRRVGPFLAFTGSTAALLATHFSIYANGIIIGSSALRMRASFLFHDAPNSLPIATFVLSVVTVLLIATVVMSAMRLLLPEVLDRHFLRLRHVDAHRTRVVLTTLVFLAVGAGFLRQFVTYALTGDADPAASAVRVPLLVVYYLLSFTLLLLLGSTVWRTISVVWGDLTRRRTRSFRRSFTYLLSAESWLWGVTLVLNGAILLFSPIFQPSTDVDNVFVTNSRGVTMFFVPLALGIYLIQRWSSKRYTEFLMRNPQATKVARNDTLSRLTIASVGTWSLIALLTWRTDLAPLTQLILRVAAVAVILPFFAVRIEIDPLDAPQLKHAGAAQILFLALVTSVLAGFMLWGIGNSVTTIYSAGRGGFITPEEATLQPYAVGLRILGSLFIAIPLTLTLWFVTSRFQNMTNPGPLLLTAVSIVAGMNLLLTIDPTGQYDAVIRQTDVLIGFRIVGLPDFDRVVVTLLWIAVAGVGFLASASLLARGLRRYASTSPSHG